MASDDSAAPCHEAGVKAKRSVVLIRISEEHMVSIELIGAVSALRP
jgi:hypothetical protein